jgi:hypothetical protein
MTTSTEHDSEIDELAELLIARHGERAMFYVIHQSLEAGDRGDRRTMEAWCWIADAAEKVWKAKVEPVKRDETSRWRAMDMRNYLTGHVKLSAVWKIVGRAVRSRRDRETMIGKSPVEEFRRANKL